MQRDFRIEFWMIAMMKMDISHQRFVKFECLVIRTTYRIGHHSCILKILSKILEFQNVQGTITLKNYEMVSQKVQNESQLF